MAGQAIGELLRRRRVDAAIQDWNDRLEREHWLNSDEVEALEPYGRYLCHYGRGLDLAVAAVVSGAWIVSDVGRGPLPSAGIRPDRIGSGPLR